MIYTHYTPIYIYVSIRKYYINFIEIKHFYMYMIKFFMYYILFQAWWIFENSVFWPLYHNLCSILYFWIQSKLLYTQIVENVNIIKQKIIFIIQHSKHYQQFFPNNCFFYEKKYQNILLILHCFITMDFGLVIFWHYKIIIQITPHTHKLYKTFLCSNYFLHQT